MGYTIWGSKHIYFLHDVQIASDTHLTSHSDGTRLLPGPGREVDHSSPSSAEIKNQSSYISSQQILFLTAFVTVTSKY